MWWNCIENDDGIAGDGDDDDDDNDNDDDDDDDDDDNWPCFVSFWS